MIKTNQLKLKRIWQLAVVFFVICITAQFASAQKKNTQNPKTVIVSQLVNLTSSSFPSNIFQKGLDEGKKEFKQSLLSDFSQKLETTNKFTPEQRIKLKPKLPNLVESIFVKFETIMVKHLSVSKLVDESMTRNFAKDFTTAELRGLVTFMKSANGKVFLKYTRAVMATGAEVSEQTNPDTSEMNMLIAGKFLETPVGDRFFDVFVKKTSDDIAAKIGTSFGKIMKEFKKELTPETLDEMISELLQESSQQ